MEDLIDYTFKKDKTRDITRISRIIVHEYLFKNGYFKTADKFAKQYQIQAEKGIPHLKEVIFKYYKQKIFEKRKIRQKSNT